MGCKQYARMLGLSRGYPHILYLSLSKWDAAPLAPFFHKAAFRRKFRWHAAAGHPGFCHCSSFSVACQVAVQSSGPLTPASRLGPRSGVSDLKGKNFVCPAGATSQRRDPWLRRHPRKFPGARFSACRPRIPQDSRLFVHDVHARAHPGTPGDRLAAWPESEIASDRLAIRFLLSSLYSTLGGGNITWNWLPAKRSLCWLDFL
jgi:hypothetical protein